MKISLILATVGRTDDLAKVIDSLVAQSDRTFQLIVVDQNSDDRLRPYLDTAIQTGLELTHLKLNPPSLSGARNLGLQHATGSIVAFPDDDCWYEADVIRHVRERFSAADSPDGVLGYWVEQADARGLAPTHEVLSLKAWQRYRGGEASSITLFFKRALLNSLDGFDERFGVGQWFGAAEEIDFLLRALKTGAVLVRDPLIRVHHHYATQPAADVVARRSARARARGTGGIYAKHRLSAWVVTRGLIAPWAAPLARLHLQDALRGWQIAVGRLEGYLHWRNEVQE